MLGVLRVFVVRPLLAGDLLHPAGIGDSIPMGQIGGFQLGPWEQPK